MSQHTSFDLPQELVDIIIDQVDDVQTLVSCTTVCRTFHSRSRERLFECIELPLVTSQDTIPVNLPKYHCTRFLEFLRNFPTVRSLIQEIRIKTQIVVQTAISVTMASSRSESTPYLKSVMENDLPEVLMMLPDLQRFVLQGDTMDWRLSPQALKDALVHTFQKPSLTHLTVTNVHAFSNSAEVLSILLGNTSVRHFQLRSAPCYKTQVASGEPYSRLQGTPLPTLESLVVDYSGLVHFVQVIEACPSLAFLDNLRRLHVLGAVWNDVSPGPTLIVLLKTVQETLEHLNVALYGSLAYVGYNQEPYLANLQSLQTLSFDIYEYPSTPDVNSHVMYLNWWSDSLRSAKQLRELRITTRDPSSSIEAFGEPLLKSCRLDRTLVDLAELRRVRVAVTMGRAVTLRNPDQDHRRLWEGALPSIHEKGILQMIFLQG